MAQCMVDDPQRPAILVNEPKYAGDILADSRRCRLLYRASMTSFLARELPEHEVWWTWFRSEPNACLANHVLRKAPQAVIRDITILKWEYEVPEGVEALRVWKPGQSWHSHP